MAAIPIRELTSSFQQRYSNTGRAIHTDFSAGMMRDVPSWQSPDGACWDAQDMLCDFPTKIRKRGGTTSPAAGNSAATVENLVSYRSGGVDALTGVWGSLGKAGCSVQSFNTSTGAPTSVTIFGIGAGSSNVFACRPFQHGNLLIFPFQALGTTTNDRNLFLLAGGGTTGAQLTLTGSTVTANDNRITGVTGSPFLAGHLGEIIGVASASAAYVGRIVEITSSSAVRVEPVPVAGFTGVAGNVAPLTQSGFVATDNQVTGRYGLSYQNRIVMGYTLITQGVLAANYAKGLDVQPNRVIWSQLQTEAMIQSGFTMDGLVPFLGNPFGVFNFVDIPGLGGMTGLAAAGDGQLIVFGPQKTYRISGFLATETVANPSFSFSVDQISSNIGVQAPISALDRPDRSIQYSPSGLIFAGNNGIYIYNGSEMRPLLEGRNARYYQDRRRAGNVIHGSFYSLPKNHYYLSMSGSDGGLCINLDTDAVTRFTNIDLFDCCPDPTDATKLWGARWWDTTGAAPTMTKGQLIGLESIWLPTSANKNDADGTAVTASWQSKAYGAGEVAVNKRPQDVQFSYDLRGSGSPTLTLGIDTKLNTSDASYANISTTVANTGSATGTYGARVLPLVAEGPAVEIKAVQNAASDSFEILGLDLGVQQDSVL